jgi:hypothetical protein
MHFVTFLYEKCHSGSVVTCLANLNMIATKDNFLDFALRCQTPNTGYTWTPGIATHFLFLYDFIIIGNMLLNVFLQ